VLSGVPRNLPALLRGEKVQQKAAQVGFDWEKPEQALQKVFEEARELEAELSGGGRVGEELGDLLFAVVNTARLAGVNSELALTAATDKFIGRFADMEALARKEGLRLDEMGLEALDALWERIKSGAPGENKV
jgi:tetrapyrrole methylase family protein/MazG family protein